MNNTNEKMHNTHKSIGDELLSFPIFAPNIKLTTITTNQGSDNRPVVLCRSLNSSAYFSFD